METESTRELVDRMCDEADMLSIEALTKILNLVREQDACFFDDTHVTSE